MSNHTPGPWEIGSQNGTFGDEGIVGVVAPLKTNSYGRPFRQYVAQYVTPENARLIAAAPEMLEALQATVDYLSLYATPEANELWAKTAAAIRKAKGVSP